MKNFLEEKGFMQNYIIVSFHHKNTVFEHSVRTPRFFIVLILLSLQSLDVVLFCVSFPVYEEA